MAMGRFEKTVLSGWEILFSESATIYYFEERLKELEDLRAEEPVFLRNSIYIFYSKILRTKGESLRGVLDYFVHLDEIVSFLGKDKSFRENIHREYLCYSDTYTMVRTFFNLKNIFENAKDKKYFSTRYPLVKNDTVQMVTVPLELVEEFDLEFD